MKVVAIKKAVPTSCCALAIATAMVLLPSCTNTHESKSVPPSASATSASSEQPEAAAKSSPTPTQSSAGAEAAKDPETKSSNTAAAAATPAPRIKVPERAQPKKGIRQVAPNGGDRALDDKSDPDLIAAVDAGLNFYRGFTEPVDNPDNGYAYTPYLAPELHDNYGGYMPETRRNAAPLKSIPNREIYKGIGPFNQDDDSPDTASNAVINFHIKEKFFDQELAKSESIKGERDLIPTSGAVIQVRKYNDGKWYVTSFATFGPQDEGKHLKFDPIYGSLQIVNHKPILIYGYSEMEDEKV